MNRRAVAVALVVLAFFAVRFATADESYVSETMGWMASQTGVELPAWYADYPWLPVGLNTDGMIFTTQVVDPFGWDGHTTRIRTAGYRFTRVGYPLAAKAVTLGIDDLAPIGLFVVSTVGVAICAAVALRMRDRWGPWAWLLVANPAVLLGYLSGTAEPLGIGLAALALTGSEWWTVAMASVRPDLLVTLVNRRRAFMLAAGTAAVLWVAGWWLFGSVPAGHNLAFPFTGYLDASTPAGWALAGIGLAVTVVGALHRDLSWVLSGLLVLMFAEPVLRNPLDGWRTSGMLWLAIASGTLRHVGVRVVEDGGDLPGVQRLLPDRRSEHANT